MVDLMVLRCNRPTIFDSSCVTRSCEKEVQKICCLLIRQVEFDGWQTQGKIVENANKADSHGNEKLIRKWTKSVFVFFSISGPVLTS